jgi:hypothetical protein
MKDKFNGNTEKRHPPPHLIGHEVYEMVKDIHVVRGKWKRTGKNNDEIDMWKKQSIFLELPYWIDLDVHHSIDVMHVEKNMCESLLRTLLNMDGRTSDHGHARADLKKMGIRPELCLDDSVKGMELLTSCINLSKHEKKEFCGSLKNVKVPSGYSTYVSRLISFLDLKVALNMYCLRRRIQNILSVNVQEAIINFCFFFNTIGQKVLSEKVLESLEKRHYKTLCFLEIYFPRAFFDISVNFTTHLIKEIKLLRHVFLHQMYVYERFNGILKSFVTNSAYPEGNMVQTHCTEEAMEWALNYANSSNPISVPKSHYEGRLIGKWIIGKKAIAPDPHLFRCAHFHVFQ